MNESRSMTRIAAAALRSPVAACLDSSTRSAAMYANSCATK